MELNLTLGVQVVHFICAYVVLRRLLLAPALQLVLEERAYRAALNAAIADRRVVVEQKEHERDERWHDYQQRLAALEPSLLPPEEQIITGLTPELTIPQITQREMSQEVARLVPVLVKNGEQL